MSKVAWFASSLISAIPAYYVAQQKAEKNLTATLEEKKALQSSVTNLQGTISSAHGKIDHLIEQKESLNVDLDKVVNKYLNLVDSDQTQGDEIEYLSSQINNLEDELRNKTNDIDDLAEEITITNDMLSSAREEIDAKSATILSQTSQISQLESDFASLESDLASYSTLANSDKPLLIDLHNEIKTIMEEDVNDLVDVCTMFDFNRSLEAPDVFINMNLDDKAVPNPEQSVPLSDVLGVLERSQVVSYTQEEMTQITQFLSTYQSDDPNLFFTIGDSPDGDYPEGDYPEMDTREKGMVEPMAAPDDGGDVISVGLPYSLVLNIGMQSFDLSNTQVRNYSGQFEGSIPVTAFKTISLYEGNIVAFEVEQGYVSDDDTVIRADAESGEFRFQKRSDLGQPVKTADLTISEEIFTRIVSTTTKVAESASRAICDFALSEYDEQVGIKLDSFVDLYTKLSANPLLNGEETFASSVQDVLDGVDVLQTELSANSIPEMVDDVTSMKSRISTLESNQPNPIMEGIISNEVQYPAEYLSYCDHSDFPNDTPTREYFEYWLNAQSDNMKSVGPGEYRTMFVSDDQVQIKVHVDSEELDRLSVDENGVYSYNYNTVNPITISMEHIFDANFRSLATKTKLVIIPCVDRNLPRFGTVIEALNNMSEDDLNMRLVINTDYNTVLKAVDIPQ